MKTTLHSLLFICFLFCLSVHAHSSSSVSAMEKRMIKMMEEEKTRIMMRGRTRNTAAATPSCPGGKCTLDYDCGLVMYANGTTTQQYCSNGVCTPRPLGTAPLGASCSTDYDCADLNCYQGICTQEVGNGCACSDTADCDANLLCVNNKCIPFSNNGGACVTDDQCPGECSNGVCVTIPVGGDCFTSLGCASGSFCNVYDQCALIQNNMCGVGNYAGYCPPRTPGGSTGVCEIIPGTSNGQCFYTLSYSQGQACNPDYVFECAIGLACINSVCTQVSDGSSCNSAFDCNAITQACACYGSQATPTCRSFYPGVAQTPCGAGLNNALSCSLHCGNSSGAYLYNYPCLQNCQQQQLVAGCCLLCETDISLGPIYNVNGTCATGTSLINCCSATQYCSTPTKSSLCTGFTTGATTGSVTSSTSGTSGHAGNTTTTSGTMTSGSTGSRTTGSTTTSSATTTACSLFVMVILLLLNVV